MFNLEQAIAEWRRKMIVVGVKIPEVLDELEAHLREDFERRAHPGADPKQAFEEAVSQIGRPEALMAEFGKTEMTTPLPATASSRFALWVSGLAFFWILLMGGYGLLKNGMSATARLLGFGAILMAGLAWGRGRWLYRFLPVIPNKRTRTAIQWPCIGVALAWLPVFAYFVLPHFEMTVGQLIALTLWSLTLPPAILGISEGMEEAMRRKPALTIS